MIPLKDTLPTRSFPLVNTLFIIANLLVFVFELSLGPALEGFVSSWGMVPLRIVGGSDPERLLTVLSSMFMHGGWMHVIGNMWFLYIFGDNVEDALGKVRYVFFYFLCGIGAAAAQVVVDPTSKIPMIGASGAIAGILGAYLSLYPRARVLTFLPLFIFFQILELPAVLFIVFWFVIQAFQGVASLGDTGGGTAWWAHIGGFVIGLTMVRLLVPRARTLPNPRDHYGPVRRRVEW
ncbi:MAG: rhomboid family intramembrane serine protease [Deltaproteobacteria bacterium]|nr:rhomboid family intramembrane serine protease [Deltaproteobacteria bacterium]